MSEFIFGLSGGWLSNEVAKVAKKHGATLVNHIYPQCSCGRGCHLATCESSKRHWFTGPNLGSPYDQRLENAVLKAIKPLAEKSEPILKDESELLIIVQTMLPVLYARCDRSPECADLYHSACEELKKRKISLPSLCKHLK